MFPISLQFSSQPPPVANANFPKFGNLTTHANETFTQWKANRNYIVKNAFDINGENVAEGVYDSGHTTLTLPLTNLSVATPVAGTPIAQMTNMMAFVLIDGGAV